MDKSRKSGRKQKEKNVPSKGKQSRKKSGLPKNILQRSLKQLPQYVIKENQFKGKSIKDLGPTEHDRIVQSMKKQDIWVKLHSSWDKNKGKAHWTKHAHEITLYTDDEEFQRIVAKALEGYDFSVSSIKLISPSFEKIDKSEDDKKDPENNGSVNEAEDFLFVNEMLEMEMNQFDSSSEFVTCEPLRNLLTFDAMSDDPAVGHIERVKTQVSQLSVELKEQLEKTDAEMLISPEELSIDVAKSILFVHLDHWILVEINNSENSLTVHDPEGSKTSAEELSILLNQIEDRLKMDRVQSNRKRAVLDMTVDADDVGLSNEAYCFWTARQLLREWNRNLSQIDCGQGTKGSFNELPLVNPDETLDDLEKQPLLGFESGYDCNSPVNVSVNSEMVENAISTPALEGQDDRGSIHIGEETWEPSSSPSSSDDDDDNSDSESHEEINDEKSGSDSQKNICDNDNEISMKEMCSVLGVDPSILSYSPPAEFEMTILAADVNKMYTFPTTENPNNERSNGIFQIYKWAPVVSKYLSESQVPCSFSATHWISYGTKESDSGDGAGAYAYAYGKCGGNCQMKFLVRFIEKPKIGEDLKCTVRTRGTFSLVQTETTARRLSGTERVDIQKILRHDKSNKVFLENTAHLSALRLLHANKFVKSERVLNTARSQAKTNLRPDKDELTSLGHIMRNQLDTFYSDSPMPGFLRQLQEDPFHYEMMLWPQAKLTNTLAQKFNVWITLDSSQRIVRLPSELKYQKKRVSNYIAEVTVDTKVKIPSYTLSEMVTTKNKTNNIKAFLNRTLDDVKGAGEAKEKLIAGVVTDMSMALIHAVCETVNVEKFKSYINRSHDILQGKPPDGDKSVIFVCVNHVLNAFRRNIQKRTLDVNVKTFAMSCIARIQECCDLDDFETMSTRVICMLGTRFLDVERRSRFLKQITAKDHSIPDIEEDDVLDFVKDVRKYEKSEKQPKHSVLKTNNPFYETFFLLRQNICPDLPLILPKRQHARNTRKPIGHDTTESADPSNPFYCPQILELLESTYIPLIPFYAAMVPRKCGFPEFIRKTNSVVESAFKNNKKEWHTQRDMHNVDFVLEHSQLVHGKVLRAWLKVHENRGKMGISKISLDTALGKEKATTANLDPKLSHLVEEKWKPRKAKSASSSTSNLKHLSDVELLNKSKMESDQSKSEKRRDKTTPSDFSAAEQLELDSIQFGTHIIPPLLYLPGITIHILQTLGTPGAWLDARMLDYIAQNWMTEYLEEFENAVFLPHSIRYLLHLAEGGDWIEDDNIKTECFANITIETDLIYYNLFTGNHFILVKFKKARRSHWNVTVMDPLGYRVAGDTKNGVAEMTEMIKEDLFIKSPTAVVPIFSTPKVTKIPGGNGHDCGIGVLWTLKNQLETNGDRADYRANVKMNLSKFRSQLLMDFLNKSPTGHLIVKCCRNDPKRTADFIKALDDQLLPQIPDVQDEDCKMIGATKERRKHH